MVIYQDVSTSNRGSALNPIGDLYPPIGGDYENT